MTSSSRPKGLLTRSLKLVGRLTSPETRSGKLFAKAEAGLTKATAKLSESPTWLRVSGGSCAAASTCASAASRSRRRRSRPCACPPPRTWRSMRDQVRRLNHQVEALGSQLELVVEMLEKQEERSPKAPGSREDSKPLEPAARRPGT